MRRDEPGPLHLLVVLLMGCGPSCSSSSGPAVDGGVASAPGVVAAAPGTVAVPAAGDGQGVKGRAAGGAPSKALQVRFDRISVKHGGDKSVVRRGVRPHMSEVRTCYRGGLARQNGLHGQLEVALAIRKGGRVAGARLASSNLSDRATANCIVRASRRWSFRGATKRIDAVVRFKLFHG